MSEWREICRNQSVLGIDVVAAQRRGLEVDTEHGAESVAIAHER